MLEISSTSLFVFFTFLYYLIFWWVLKNIGITQSKFILRKNEKVKYFSQQKVYKYSIFLKKSSLSLNLN